LAASRAVGVQTSRSDGASGELSALSRLAQDDLLKRQVRLHREQRQQKVSVLLQRRCASATRFGGTAAGLTEHFIQNTVMLGLTS
jgi:hypothetical protein